MSAASPKRRLARDERRLVIEDVAAELFAKHGYAGTRVADVAAAAGVSRQLLLRHFATKQQLHRALLTRHQDGLLDRLVQGMASDGNLAARIAASIEAWFSYLKAEPFAARMLFYDTTGIPENAELHAQMRADARALTATLLRAEPDLDIEDDEVETVAELIRAATTGLALWHADHANARSTIVTRVTVRMICRTLGLMPPAEYR